MQIAVESLPPRPIESALARELLAGRVRIAGLPLPASVAQLEPPAERFDADERATLARELEAALVPLEPPVAVLDGLRKLARPGTTLVVCGQQPGFTCAPLLSLYKALHAVRLARSLEQAWERPVVPLFWNHADDHDVAEVHHAWFVNEHLDLQKVVLPGLSSGRRVLSRVVLGPDQKLDTVRTAVRALHADGEFVDEALDALFPRPGETLAQAFTRGMTRLLGHLGLVVLEPDWIRGRMSRALTGLLAADLSQGLEQGSAALRAAGHAPALDPAKAALVFRVEGGLRRALRLGGEGLRYDEENGSRTRAELAAEIVDAPEEFSPGALLRPLVQDMALPVACYVGGPNELAYHAQLPALRARAGVPATPFVLRASVTLVEPKVAESLARLGLGAAQVLAAGSVEEPVVEEPEVVRELRAIAERAAQAIRAQQEPLAAIDRGLAQTLKRTADAVRELVEKTCAKAERAHANATGKGSRHARRVRSALLPQGLPQERVLGPLPFVARHGRAWIDRLFDRLPPVSAGDLLVHLDGGDSR